MLAVTSALGVRVERAKRQVLETLSTTHVHTDELHVAATDIMLGVDDPTILHVLLGDALRDQPDDQLTSYWDVSASNTLRGTTRDLVRCSIVRALINDEEIQDACTQGGFTIDQQSGHIRFPSS